MPLTVFAKGELGEKVIDGERKLAFPIACDDGLSMGTGLAYEDGRATFWGLASPKKVISSYRGMKIAELVEEFWHGTLAACWYSGNRDVHPSDQKYVDEIEAKIGKPARERILGMVPENFDDVLTMLQEKDIHFAGWEIEQEVKDGVLRVTPKLQTYLDDFHRKQDLAKQEEYGRIITPEEAQATIGDVPFIGDVGRWFLEAYNQHVDPNTRIAVRYRDFGIFEDYVIAKSKEDGRVEVTIKGGMMDPIIMGPQPTLKIGLQYDGHDAEFQPTVPEKPSGLLYRLGLKKAEEPKMSEKFPLLERRYGATVSPAGRIKDPTVQVDVQDRRLEGLANQLYQSIQALRTA